MDFHMTAKELLAIYDAGRERGKEEYAAFDWGCSASGKYLDELENCLVWDRDTSLCLDMDYDHKIAWWESFKNEIT